MDQSREERMQQRLRGAVRRHIKDVDFGLSIPAAPLVPAGPSSPPEETQSVGSPDITRVTTPSTPTANIDVVKTPNPQSAFDANTSAKRRRLDSDTVIRSSGGRSTRSSRTAPRSEGPVVQENTPLGQVVSSTGQVSVAPDDVVDSQRVLASSSSTLDRTLEPQTTPSVHFAEDTTIISVDGHTATKPTYDDTQEDTVSRLGAVDDSVPSSDIDTPVPTRKRRRSSHIVDGDGDDEDELSPHHESGRVRDLESSVSKELLAIASPSVSGEVESAEEIDDQQAATLLSRNRSKRHSLEHRVASVTAEEAEQADLSQPRKRRGKSAKNAQQRSKRAGKVRTSKIHSDKPKVRLGSPVPVTVHRLTQAPLYSDDESDVDILNAEIPHSKRAGVNSIDVLRQICQEMFETALESLEDGRRRVDDVGLRREYLAKWRAVDLYADEVYARLVDHTLNLDNTCALTRRVKAENKKKLDLREKILHVRAEREKVALRMDEIRIRHENESFAANELIALNTSLHDIEVAVGRGKQESQRVPAGAGSDLVPFEMQLRRVANLASQKSESGGALKQLKDFNAFLENAAKALETRRA